MARGQIANRVADLRPWTVPAIPEHLAMAAARKVAALKQAALLFVEREGRLLGVIDERTLADAADDDLVARVMTPIGPCLDPAMLLAHARDVFRVSGLSALPVAVGAFVLGAVARDEVEQALARARIPARRRAVRVRAAA
jgi:CBS domain-containing protein